MDFRLCILFMVLVVSTQGDTQECSLLYKSMGCGFDMVCEDVVQTEYSWSSFERHRCEVEDCSFYIGYQGEEIVPVYLVFKDSQPNLAQAVPIIHDDDDDILNIMYSLDLSYNNYDNNRVIESMQNLALLNLSNNKLTTAHLSNQNDLNKLTEIDLSHNVISDIDVNAYDYPYITLKKIDVSHNNLVKIPDAVFDRINNLQTLDLSHNYIQSLSHFTFEGIKNLLHLNLSNNRLTDINSSLFRFSELKVLKLSGNRIKEVKVNDFDHLNKLEILDLSSNSIKTIDYNVFQNMILLNSLDLSNNLWDTANMSLMLINLQSLGSIDLSSNQLKSLPIGVFQNKTIYNFFIGSNSLEGTLVKGMFEGVNVTSLDLSYQFLTAIKDYAFSDLVSLNTLFLNGNRIQSLSKMCFKTLTNLQMLDLSNNEIVNIDFNTADLTKLQSLLLRNNRLLQIKYECFQNLNSLEYLDLSENSISKIEPNSFQSLTSLINLRFSDNPLSGTLETDTFGGLVSLPNLDISHNLLTTVKNASFNGMNELKELNMSRSLIKELQYNVFAHTGSIETLDLSHNKLEIFCINLTELIGLGTFLLNNNNLKTISSTSLRGLLRLNKISLAYNAFENIHNKSFSSLIDLHYLDLSYNEKFVFSENLLEKTKNLDSLNLSGIKTDIHFAHIENETISELLISDAKIDNVNALKLTKLTHLGSVVLSKNNISKLEMGAFSGIGTVRFLDLSFNKISFIQPGVFKDNEHLHSLNISHNSLSVLGYGIFRGLIYLNTLDLSYNNIKDMQSEKLYEVKSLSQLIVDHNQIESINVEEFAGTSLSKLSIGDNPLSCRILVKFKKIDVPFQITAIKVDEHSGENVDGVTCNKDRVFEPTASIDKVTEKNDILVDIRNILYNVSNKNTLQKNAVDDSVVYVKYLENMTNIIEKLSNVTSKVMNIITKSNSENNDKFTKLTDIIEISNTNNNEKLINVTSRVINIIEKSNNDSNEKLTNLTSRFINLNNNKNKKELDKTIADQKQTVINELESKSMQTRLIPMYTETCVALILLILVGLILYKLYTSRMFVRNRLSTRVSTHELPSDMENSTV